MQTVIVLLIVAVAAVYLARRVYRALRRSSSPCDTCGDCPLKNAGKCTKQ